jgi:hypothetical protein
MDLKLYHAEVVPGVADLVMTSAVITLVALKK